MGWSAAEVWARTMLNVLFAVAEKSEQSLADMPYMETPLRTRFSPLRLGHFCSLTPTGMADLQALRDYRDLSNTVAFAF